MEKRPAIIGGMPNPVLAIDVGACTLAAAVRDASGRVTPLLIDGTTTPLARLVVQAGQPRPAREGAVAMLFQSPRHVVTARWTLGRIIAEPFRGRRGRGDTVHAPPIESG